ncbi:MAG: tRNA 2-thiouridine(34) synthase MnmA [Candidatus Paceibacterota bacterium]|jgi:tRNA-specific 2-thiouridylase
MMKNDKRKRVFVGMSGGVDSSVSAYLLKKAGYDVTGVFIKVWQPDFIECTWKEDRLDAMRVAAQLDIPFITFSAEAEYKKHVVDYMIGEYMVGRTPNPDVMCNKYVKFGAFFDFAMKNGADFVATGHYARKGKDSRDRTQDSRKNEKYPESKIMNRESANLLISTDPDKDQSYFLYQITQKQLSKTLLPIGHLNKGDVRKIAKKAKLFTADKKDSQGLCFIGKVDMKDFLKEFIKTKPGKVLNKNGEIVGSHDGAELYTIGQRHGFTILKKTSIESRFFVIARDVKKNTLTISDKETRQGQITGLILENLNWLSGQIPNMNKGYTCQIRYHGEYIKCRIINDNRLIKVLFDKAQDFISLGQSCVVFDNEICLGGGIINGLLY